MKLVNASTQFLCHGVASLHRHAPRIYYLSGIERLVNAVQDLSLARDLSSVCQIVRRAARELTGADGATFVLRDADRCYYIDEDAIGPLWKGKNFPMSTCISGWVMRHRQSVVLPDIYADERIPREAYQPTFVKSLAMVPIRTTQPIGAIGNYWAEPHAATPDEVKLLQALADSTSVALENIQVYNELEQRVRERTNELQMANRELEAFSASVSHDLRTPLTSVLGFSRLLAADPELARNAKWHTCVTRIAEAAERMNGLIEDLLHLAHVSRGDLHRQPLDLAEIARQVIATLQNGSDRCVDVRMPEHAPAFGDTGLIRIVLENLLGNAWKFTSQRTNAKIELGLQEGSVPTYFIRDNGAGFDMRKVDRLFAPFERLHSQAQFPGTGVGLTTVQRIIHRHGGDIWAQSAENHGATFFFTLPSPSVNTQSALLGMLGHH